MRYASWRTGCVSCDADRRLEFSLVTDVDLLPPMATPRVSSGAVFVNEAGEVLMVRPTYKSYWDVPGGYVEPGESPRAACIREVREELGISPDIGRLLVVDWAPAEGEGDKLLFLFDGGVLAGYLIDRIELQVSEVDQHAFYPAAELPGVTIPRLVRRLSAALGARRDGDTRYLEHGA
jgi:ADP-ribose pyrophosphatase YjhB (NUDIX family)